MSQSSKHNSFVTALGEIPIFPLPQAVLFPRALFPIHIFEPRYRAMLLDCIATRGALAIALIVDPKDIDANGNPRIAPIAGAGIVVEHQTLPDGRANIVVHGRARVRLEELAFVPPYRRARATLLEDTRSPSDPRDRVALLSAMTSFAREVHKRDPDFSISLPPGLETGALADLCAHHLVIDAQARQSILIELDSSARVQRVIRELAQQHVTLLNEGSGVLN